MKPIWLLALALLVAIPASDATLLSQSVRGTAGTGGGSGGEWADVYVATSGVATELATANRVVGIDGTTVDDWAPSITFPASGCVITYESGGAYDGENSVLLVPPDSGVQPANCGIVGQNLTNAGANDIAQVNIRFVAVLGSRYIDLASQSKWLCVGISSTPGGSRLNRACSFTTYEPDPSLANGWVASVTADELQSYHEPEIAGCFFWDCGTAAQKFLIVRSTSDHGGSPAVAGAGEPLYFEFELDVRQDRGNANGRSRMYVRTRDGLINRTIDIPLNWLSSWDFTWDQVIEIEGLGWYWNTAGTAHADNWIRYSHIAVSANRAVNDPIGPPPGFNQ